MKLLLMGSLLFSGGSAVAMQNEAVSETVDNAYQQVKTMVQKRFGKHLAETVKETGFPYPSEQALENLTDEQEAILVSTIDQINAEYDWANMTDEEIRAALDEIKVEMDALREELGIEAIQTQAKSQFRKGRHWNDDFVPNGDGTQDGECPYDDSTDDVEDDVVEDDVV